MKCPKCRGEHCETCGGSVCTTHCYCQSVVIGSVNHKVCCKCGDRVAMTSTWQPIFYWPSYPQPYYPNWQWLITITSSGTNVAGNTTSVYECTSPSLLNT